MHKMSFTQPDILTIVSNYPNVIFLVTLFFISLSLSLSIMTLIAVNEEHFNFRFICLFVCYNSNRNLHNKRVLTFNVLFFCIIFILNFEKSIIFDRYFPRNFFFFEFCFNLSRYIYGILQCIQEFFYFFIQNV